MWQIVATHFCKSFTATAFLLFVNIAHITFSATQDLRLREPRENTHSKVVNVYKCGKVLTMFLNC